MPREVNPGFVRTPIAVRLPLAGFFDQAGAITYLLSYVPGFRGEIEKIVFVPDVAGAGAGATHVVNVRKGNATGTIVATVTVALATHVMGGAGIVGSVSAANDETAKFRDTDTISITKDAGTVFSAAGGTLIIWFRQRPQARS